MRERRLNMKNRSIRFKLTLWISLLLAVVAGVTLAAAMWASGTVLEGTIRDYLISTAEKNVDDIRFTKEESDRGANIYIPYGGGYLEIDLDFMEVVNDVHTALYTEDGTMLYGENPLSRQTMGLAFGETRTWIMEVGGVRYDLYDRKLNLDSVDGEQLWIRGVVPETKSASQLGEILRLSLILLPILIVISVILSYLLADRFLSPIRRIERTANRVTRGDDLGKRIEEGKNNDEIGRLAKVFNEMLDRLQGSFEAERRFTSDASHELRTPTTVILAQADYTLEKERSAQEYEEALEVIRAQGRRMSALISDMLDYTRMEQSGRYDLSERVDLSLLTSEICADFDLIGKDGISLETHVEEGITVRGNKLLLSRMITNLTDNAYKYGRRDGHVRVTLSHGEGTAILEVADDGIGVPEGERDKIFDRFYRVESSRTTKGTGLGLAMVKKIALLHGAEIGLESEVGSGSVFRVTFNLTDL